MLKACHAWWCFATGSPVAMLALVPRGLSMLLYNEWMRRDINVVCKML